MSAQAISSLVLAQAADTVSSLMGMAPILLMVRRTVFSDDSSSDEGDKKNTKHFWPLWPRVTRSLAPRLLGKVTKVSDSYVTVEVAELADKPVEIIMQKASVSAVLQKGTIKAL